MRAGESAVFTNPLTATSPTFQLLGGGKYWFGCQGGTYNSGTVALQRQAPDGFSWLTVGGAASVTTDGGGVVDLPPGTYRVSLSTTGMSVSVEVVRIPEE